MTIAEIRDTLAEARRYAKSNPREASHLATDSEEELCQRWDDPDDGPFFRRLSDNLNVAIGAILSDPEVFTGYIDGVRHELLSLKGD